MVPKKATVSLIKADVGSIPGHHLVHQKQIEKSREILSETKNNGLINDFYVFNCGDDIELLLARALLMDTVKTTKRFTSSHGKPSWLSRMRFQNP